MSDGLIGFLVLWGILTFPFALWASKIADYRGRAEGWGIGLGFMFGVFGVALAWLLPPNEPVVWTRRAEWEATHGRVSYPEAGLPSPRTP